MLVYCPIDLPKVPSINLEGFQESKFACWNYYRLTDKSQQYSYNEVLEEFRDKNTEFIEWLSLFPYVRIVNIKYNIQTTSVNPHIDFTKPNDNLNLYNNNFYNEPCGYRCVIRGKRKNALYLLDQDNKKCYTELPDETDTYVIRHTTGCHGVDDELGRETLFFHFEIDQNKHNELLKKSYQKYKEYAVYMNTSVEFFNS